VNFEVATELRLFGESVRAAIGDWEAPLEPELGSWLDDRDDALAERLAAAGWEALWCVDDLGAVVTGAVELGRTIAPLSTLDDATLGAPLALDGRIRHGAYAETGAVPQPGWGLALGRPAAGRRREQTLDGTGTVVAEVGEVTPLSRGEAEARWAAWTAATLGYLAGLAAAAQAAAVTHARNREQFGRPLAKLPAIQARLADAALAVDGLKLTAWLAATRTSGPPLPSGSEPQGSRAPSLLWAGAACREVTASAHQVHGAIGFALETGLHRYYRRAKTLQVWAAAVCRACE
jgi:Acyl-CoA dehydrogenase, C-terminal domain